MMMNAQCGIASRNDPNGAVTSSSCSRAARRSMRDPGCVAPQLNSHPQVGRGRLPGRYEPRPHPGKSLGRIPCRTLVCAQPCSIVTSLTCRLPTRISLWPMAHHRPLERTKQFLFKNFERLLVVLLVAFLSFFYLPVIVAGFYGGRRFAVVSGLFIASFTLFIQATQGLGMDAGLTQDAMMTLIPWAGFLILTGYVVGGLAEQRAARLADLKNAYLATLEVLTFHIESAERHQEGHSTRVAQLAADMGVELKLPEIDLENLRIAALLHEVGTADQRLLKLLSRSVTDESD